MNPHKFFVHRFEKLSISQGVLVSLDLSNGVKNADPKELIAKAITNWAKSTPIGKQAFEYTCGDLNIGDLSTYTNDPDLIESLKTEGVYNLEITDVDFKSWLYDDILIDGQEVHDHYFPED